MEFLHMLESIRNPILSGFFYLITLCGGGMLSIIICILLYWCYNKKFGVQLALNIIISGIIVQILKIIFIVQRPWILDPSLHSITNSFTDATGYSFPSGHSQQGTVFFFTLAYFLTNKNASPSICKEKKFFTRIACFTMIILITLSRLYFGVHTPKDVCVGFLIGFIVCFINNILFSKYLDNPKYIFGSTLLIIILSIFTMIYTYLRYNNGFVEFLYAEDAFKLAGASIAFAITLFIDKNYINFNEKAPIKKQIIKIIIGILSFVIIEKSLKTLLGVTLVLDAFRYFVVIIWSLGLYTMLFKKFFVEQNIAKTNFQPKD